MPLRYPVPITRRPFPIRRYKGNSNESLPMSVSYCGLKRDKRSRKGANSQLISQLREFRRGERRQAETVSRTIPLLTSWFCCLNASPPGKPAGNRAVCAAMCLATGQRRGFWARSRGISGRKSQRAIFVSCAQKLRSQVASMLRSTIPLARSAQICGADFRQAESAQFCAIPQTILRSSGQR